MKKKVIQALYVFLSVSLVSVLSGSAMAQLMTGTPPFGSFSGGPFDTVNLANLDVHFAIPVLNNAGRGMPFTYALTYDSLVWTPVTASGAIQWQPLSRTWGWGEVGQAVTGYVLTTVENEGCVVVQNGERIVYPYVVDVTQGYVDSSNTLHPITIQTNTAPDTSNAACSSIHAVSSGSGTATDGSGYTLSVTDYVSYVVTDIAGDTIVPGSNFVGGSGPTPGSSVTDANGNQLTTSVSGTTTTLKDTLGNSALSVDAVSASQTTYSYTAPSGGTATYTMNYTNYTVATDFGVSGIPEYGPLANELNTTTEVIAHVNGFVI
jgi:hypothetical protein